MMELSHSLLLNEEALAQIPDTKKPVFIFEWLRFLDKVLGAAQKSDIKGCQRKLVEQLVQQVNESPGPASRLLIGRCLATLFTVGDASLLFDTINTFNDIMRNKDDSPSYLPVKLGAVSAMGSMYEHLGRMMGRSYEETVSILLKALKNAESQMRCEILETLRKIVTGLGTAATSTHKDIFKALRHCLTDRVMLVRCNAAKCLQEMVRFSQFLYTTDFETAASLAFRGLEGSSYEVRCAVAGFLGSLLAASQQANPATVTKGRLPTQEEAFSILSSGFLKGGIGFLKTGPGEMIKGGSSVSREIRVGVTHAYVEGCTQLGRPWLEANLGFFLGHVVELAGHPKATPTHMEAVYSRKCSAFILTSVLGRLLGERAQATAACRELLALLIKHLNDSGESSSNTASDRVEGEGGGNCSQHVVVCTLNILAWLLESLDTLAGAIVCDPTVGVVESVMSVLTHPSPACRLAAARCLQSVALAVPAQLCPLLDRTAEQLEACKMAADAIAGCSAALSALLCAARRSKLGVPHNRGKIIFNMAEDLLRSASQNSRLSLQRTQAGWLMIGAVMSLGPAVVRGLLPRMVLLWKNSFPRSARELECEKKRGDAFTWQLTLEGRAGALAAMSSFLQFCKELVTEEVIRRILSPVESGLVMLINLGPITKSYGQHLKASVTMVRLRLYETLLLLPPSTYESSYHNLLRLLVAEFSLTENPANTTTSLLRGLCKTNDCLLSDFWLPDCDQSIIEAQLQPNSASGSGALEHDVTALYKSQLQEEEALPLGVAVIDASVELFGAVFPGVALKHRLQMLSHFAECLKHSKATRQEAVQVNIFTAVLYALKALINHKNTLGPEEVKSAAIKLILGSLSHPNPVLRCAAAEALGRMAQVVGDSRFVGELAQQSFDKLRTARDAATRTGHSLALGCLHRYVGGMGSVKHLSTSVSILLALAQDSTAPVVQAWAVHALGMIADSGGPMFRGYVEPTLELCLQGALGQWNTGVLRGVGKLAGALVNCVGPETGAFSGSTLACCASLLNQSEPLVRAEAIGCLQQLHMFGPRHLPLNWLVPLLCKSLAGAHLCERRAAAACLRQLSQRQAQEVGGAQNGLEGDLFTQLDWEKDLGLLGLLRDCLGSLLAAAPLGRGLGLCKAVLTDSGPTQEDQLRDAEEGEEDAEFHASDNQEAKPNSSAARWPTRVFAAQCLQKLVLACEGSPAHFDLAMAREARLTHPQEDYLVLHLSDLVRMSFMAATSDSSPLRLEGLGMLQLVIDNFARSPEPEFPGHVLLEQFQAQVGAALRPAFSPDTPPHITALACQVCSAWIGSGVARNLADLRRVHQLLVASLAKLNPTRASLYNEAMSTLEKLAILKAWAEVYVVAMEERQKTDNSLLSLVTPELTTLSHHWLAALKDHALLSLPPEFNSQLPHEGGAFYTADTMDAVRPFYREAWPSLLYAAVLWLCNCGQELDSTDSLHLLLGSCMETLCSPPSSTPPSVALRCLQSLSTLLGHPAARAALVAEPPLCVELCHVLHRLLLTRPESSECQSLALVVCRSLADCWLEHTKAHRSQPGQEEAGEGGETGDLLPLKSLVFALLENCLCVVLRHLPQLASKPSLPRPPSPNTHLLLTACLQLMGIAPELCSPAGSVTVLPVSLHLILGVMGEVEEVSAEGVDALRRLLHCPHLEGPQRSQWVGLLQSALARLLSAGPSVQGLATLQVFLLEAPEEVSSVPNLLYPCINLLRQALLAGSPALQLACVRLLHAAFSQPHRPAVTLPLIHALAPRLLSLLGSLTNGGATAPDLLRECFSALCALLEAAPAPHRSQLLGLYIPLLAGQLLEPGVTPSSQRLAVHEAALQILLQVGPRYPQEFRAIVAAQPQVRRKLEACCGGRPSITSDTTSPKSAPPPPSIKLKTDFSNFSG